VVFVQQVEQELLVMVLREPYGRVVLVVVDVQLGHVQQHLILLLVMVVLVVLVDVVKEVDPNIGL
jgi:hypothetical protein